MSTFTGLIRKTQEMIRFIKASTELDDYGQGEQHRRWLLSRELHRPEKQPSMAVTLRSLEQTMDPIIAAQVWNNKYSLLTRLPDEILLEILSYFEVYHDPVSLYCLRRTCRTFRRLMCEPRFGRIMLPRSARNGVRYFSENHMELTTMEANALKQLLQKDGMCEKCAVYCDGPVKGLRRRISHYWHSEWGPSRVFKNNCKFLKRGALSAHCPHCRLYHNMALFSKWCEKEGEARKCLGREGAVQLCEHVHISWSQIENHMNEWHPRSAQAWEACLARFNVECHHPSHNIRCTSLEAPTWPRARLKICENDMRRVILHLEWSAHSGSEYFRLRNGKVPVAELRELFRRYRLGAARIFLPGYPASSLPEMAGFNAARCNCVHYETGQPDQRQITEGAEDQSIAKEDPYGHGFLHVHFLNRNYGLGHNGQRVDHIKHYPHGTDRPFCLITKYERDIMICYQARATKRKRIIYTPTHEWLHAMDPDTYPHPDGRHAMRQCKNGNCMNYYKRPHMYCCSGH
ncbi:hypothetical protein F5B19DRAFT_488648 [Rostrohypoxylon terebratum]|nr:hypothetical protein F5B19DRAFT_488648 [Rostrohypoxylon terebratum]